MVPLRDLGRHQCALRWPVVLPRRRNVKLLGSPSVLGVPNVPGGERDGVRDAAGGALIAHMEHGGDCALAVNQPARGFPHAARAAATNKDPGRCSGGSNRYVLPSPLVATTPLAPPLGVVFRSPLFLPRVSPHLLWSHHPHCGLFLWLARFSCQQGSSNSSLRLVGQKAEMLLLLLLGRSPSSLGQGSLVGRTTSLSSGVVA